jgi:hypothetical protein
MDELNWRPKSHSVVPITHYDVLYCRILDYILPTNEAFITIRNTLSVEDEKKEPL